MFNIGDKVRVIKGMCEGELANILRFEGEDNNVVLLEVGEGYNAEINAPRPPSVPSVRPIC